MVLHGLVGMVPLATAFGTYTLTRKRRWGTIGSAIAAAGAGMTTGVAAYWVERQFAEDESGTVTESEFSLSGVRGLSGVRDYMSPSMRRNLYGFPNMGLVSVSRDFRRYG